MFRPMQLGDLIIANAIQLCFHAVSMYVLLHRRFGSMRGHRLILTATRATLAASMMGLVIAGTLWCTTYISWPNTIVSELASVFIPSTTGIICYITFMNLMKVPELAQLYQLIKPATNHNTH